MSDGPDIVGRDRHRVALNRLFADVGARDFGQSSLRPSFFFHFGGPFSKHPVLDGVKVVIYRDGQAGIDINISESLKLGPEELFRQKLIELMRTGTEKLIVRAEKKKLHLDEDMLRFVIDEVLAKYAALQLPLPATSAEIEFAQSWLGIPSEPSEEM